MPKAVIACLVCGAPLVYLSDAVEMRCENCGKSALSNASCENGHFVCDACHGAAGRLAIRWHCGQADSKNPIAIAQALMDLADIHMHGPEHHTLVGAALLTAYRNSGGEIDLTRALREMDRRGSAVPGGICGFWGACGAAISAGIFISIVTEASPLSGPSWGQANRMTAACLETIGAVGGPRCCKRNAFLALQTATAFTAEHLHVQMELPERIICTHSRKNTECLGVKCPWNFT